MILTTILFILILGILVFVHEIGHFIAAKIGGIKVEEFAFGFPPRLWSKKRGETFYSINAIPIGGYVKMLGESEESQSPKSFSRKKPFVRAAVSVAGVLMNLILAWLILTFGFAFGMSPLVSTPDSIPGKKLTTSIIVAGVEDKTPAFDAGLKSGDVLIKATAVGENEVIFTNPESVINYTKSHLDKKIEIVFKRDNQEKNVSATLSSNREAPLGVSVVENSKIQTAWYIAPVVAFREIIRIIDINFVFLKGFFAQLLSQGEISKEVGGPVAIYVFTGMAAKAGAMVVLQFVAILSISLALINIMPFPALDGGRLLFIILEKIFRRKVIKESIENIIHAIGFVLILLFAALVTYKDIINLIKK
jgi:regulator of sigma E protease